MTFLAKKIKTDSLKEMLTFYAIILLLWTAYRIFFHYNEGFDEFIAKPILWLIPLFYLKKNILKETIKSLKINISYNIFLGLSIGVVYFFLYTLFASFRFGPPAVNPDHLTIGKVFLQMLIALSTGYIEELVFRKYLLEEALLLYNDRFVANSFITILFTLIHLPIIIFVYKYSLLSTFSYLILLAISGFIYGLVYLKNKSLIASTATHCIWNFLGTIIR